MATITSIVSSSNTKQFTTSQPQAPARPASPADKPTFDEVVDRLSEICLAQLLDFYGHSKDWDLDRWVNEDVGELLQSLAKLASKQRLIERGKAYVEVSTNEHALLDSVMKGHARPAPGSDHDMLNRHFLPDGLSFMHGQREECTIELIRL